MSIILQSERLKGLATSGRAVLGANLLPIIYDLEQLNASSSGSGTVSSVAVGNLSPLFTTVVANPTTNPAISFAAVSQSQNLFYASPNGSSGVPSFRAIVLDDLPSMSSIYWSLAGNSGTIRRD